ncbi:site-specific recombinase XerD (plasmid) [Marinitoga piezophila KA3]|uniref:Site-specific recombinase XerD n=1 Tax=Marinitoga piezophila (strain DSM 14283 / JCM 11233 / KA3) TaxID=443254 RepID=H2J8G5_MARPK|nr:tyrosine-type recombinase/integrase [Marinitoga piezophila]AEX86496.1 site-specific recombinase XerD [Marinitoga piezophila KA3]
MKIEPDKIMQEYFNYLRHYRGVSEKTLKRYESTIRDLLEYGITKKGTDRFLKSLKKYKESSIQTKIVIAKSFVKYLYEHGYIKENYLANAKAPRYHSLPKYLTDEEFKAITDKMNDYYRALAIFLRNTGLRISEYHNLTEKDIRITGEYAELRIKGKGNKERVLLIERKLLDLANKYRLFENKKSIRAIQKYFNKHGIHPHLLRHTFAVEFLNRGGAINQLQAILGHSNIAITDIYTKVTSNNVVIKAF